MYRIYLSPPHLTGEEQTLVTEALASNWVAPLGPNVDAFEKETAEYLGGGLHALALSSGTAAIHLALDVLAVGRGDTVLCSDLTFIGSAGPIRYVGAEPIFIDSDPATWNLSVPALERALETLAREGRQAKALVAVGLYGQSADMEPIQALCSRYGVALIEDAAECLGATYRGQRAGRFGDFSILSFNGNKIITTSGGGMLLARDPNRIAAARHLSTQARDPFPYYHHTRIGYNYRLSNLLAAVGRAQLRALDDRVQARRAIADRYVRDLADLPGVAFMPEAEFGRSTRWLTVLTLDPGRTPVKPADLIGKLQAEKIEARHVWKPLSLQPVFSDARVFTHDGRESVAGRLFEAGVCLPSGSALTPDEQSEVIELIRSFWR